MKILNEKLTFSKKNKQNKTKLYLLSIIFTFMMYKQKWMIFTQIHKPFLRLNACRKLKLSKQMTQRVIYFST